jgi:hypothetical protein
VAWWDEYEKHPYSEETGQCECRKCESVRESWDVARAARFIPYLNKTEPQLI